MKVKTFRAKSVADALASIKQELGKDAVILHTRAIKVGGFCGLGAKHLVEVIAANRVNVPSRRAAAAPAIDPRQAASRLLRAYGSTPADAAVSRVSPPAPAPKQPLAEATDSVLLSVSRGATSNRPVRRPSDALAGLVDPVLRKQAPEPAATEGTASSGPPVYSRVRAADPEHIREELAAIRRMVGQVLKRGDAIQPASTSEPVPPMNADDPLFEFYLRLLQGQVAEGLAKGVLEKVRVAVGTCETAEPSYIRSVLLRELAALFPVAEGGDQEPDRPVDGRPLTIALIGPTGVGKTTTLAKLAATYKIRFGWRVGLITTDTFRIAAVDQLRIYADIIGLPLHVANAEDDVSRGCAALRRCDAILIDTAGRSQHNADGLAELASMMAVARPHQTHLVLAGTASEAVLNSAADRFAPIGYTNVIFTKLDEAVNFGVLLNVAARVRADLSYLSTGQEVPDHLERTSGDRLARLVLDGSLRAVTPAVSAPPAVCGGAPRQSREAMS